MQNEMELQQVIYNLFEAQIKFGSHRFGESLPTIKQASEYFFVSVDTIRYVYLRLKQEGYISLRTGVGAAVIVQYSDSDIRRHVVEFFSCRRSAFIDMAQSTLPLFRYAQWFSFKHTSEEVLRQIERNCREGKISPPYMMSQHLLMIYGALDNDLFMRLIWQAFLFFYAPFLCVPKNLKYFKNDSEPLLNMIRLCRQKDWDGLWNAGDAYLKQMISSLCHHYDINVPKNPCEKQVEFSWNIYKKASQLCYSLSMELLRGIRCGVYPIGSFLPSPAKLAKEKQVSINTVRRSIALMNKIGAVQSINGVGSKILSPLTCPKNSDISDATVQQRLLDFVQSLQIVSLSCRDAAQMTIAAMETCEIRPWVEQFDEVERNGRYELLTYTCFELISLLAPNQTVRTIYAELLQQLFWGFPIRDMHGDRASINAYYLPYLHELREYMNRADAVSFSLKLEELLLREAYYTAKHLVKLGISDAASIISPLEEIVF